MNFSTEKLHRHEVLAPKSYSDTSQLKEDPLSNSNASLLKIDSISIDPLNENDKKEVENCKHFSIRGYVGQIRKRDKELGWPFSLDDKHNYSEESSACNLPPIVAAKFRWWRCHNCLREINPQCTVKEIETVENFSRNAQKSNNGACSHMASNKEAGILAIDLVNNNKDLIGAQTCTNKSESIGVDEAQNTVKGGVSSPTDGMNHEFREHSSCTVKFDPFLKLEMNKYDNRAAIESNYNGLVEICKPICESKKTAVSGFDDETVKSMTVCGIYEKQGTVHKSVFATNDQENNPLDYSSSDSDEIIGRQNRFAKHDEKLSTFRRAKPRKIHLDGTVRASVKNLKLDENPSTSSGQIMKRKRTRDFSDKGASTERGSQVGKKDHQDKHGVDGSPVLNIKPKKPRMDDRCTSLLPLQEVLHGGNEKRVQDPNKSITSDTTGSTYQSSTGKATDAAKQGEKKNKVPQPKSLQTFPMPDHQNYVPCLEPRWGFLLTGKEGIFGEDQINRKEFRGKYVGESSKPYKSSADTRTGQTVQWDLNFKTGDKVASIITDKPNRPPHAEDGNLTAHKNKNVFRKSKDEKSVRVKELSKSAEQQSVQNGDEVLEKEAIDDIPMEIIELLAKHPYEKRLKDAEKASTFLESVDKVNNSKRIDVKEVHANGELNFLADKNRSLHKSQSGNSKKNGFTKGESVGKIRNYDLNFSNLNVGSNEKQNTNLSRFNTIKKTLGEYPSTCNERIELDPQMERSASMYSNETIPAMQLLSLMDSGRRSSTPFNLGQQKKEFINKPPLPYDQHSNELSWPSDVSKHASLVDYGKKYPFSEKSCECLSAVSAFGALTLSLQNDTSVRRITDSHGQVSKYRRPNSKKSVHGNEASRPVKRTPKMEICFINRNPADFTMPVAGNEYMISGNNLYYGRNSYSINPLTSISPQKKKRLMEQHASSKEQAQNHIPSSFTRSPAAIL